MYCRDPVCIYVQHVLPEVMDSALARCVEGVVRIANVPVAGGVSCLLGGGARGGVDLGAGE